MANRIPEPIIQNFLTTHTSPILLTTLAEDARHCPICHHPYAPQDANYIHPILPADTHEYPVQVTNVGSCAHIFGRQCIESHIRARQPWSHTCPVCRAEWFPTPNAGRDRLLQHVNRVLTVAGGLIGADEEEWERLREIEGRLMDARNLLLEGRWL